MKNKKTKTIGFAVLGSLALIGGTTTVISCNNNSQEVTVNYKASIDPSVASVNITKQCKLDDGSYEIVLSCNDDMKKINSVAVKIGTTDLVNNTDYTFNTSLTINIKKTTLDKNKTSGDIIVKPNLLKVKANIDTHKSEYIEGLGYVNIRGFFQKANCIYFGTKSHYKDDVKDANYSMNVGQTDEDDITVYLVEWEEYKNNKNTTVNYVYVLSDAVIMFGNEDLTGFGTYEGLFMNTPATTIKFDNIEFKEDCVNFYYCFNSATNLTTLEGFEKLNLSKVTHVESMFAHCTSLTTLDLSCLGKSKLYYTKYMFHECTSLETIYVDPSFTNENIDNKELSMFDSCTNLKGGNGTTYDANKINGNYACIDTTETPGYFTAKE